MSAVCTIIGSTVNGTHNGVNYTITSFSTGSEVSIVTTTYTASAEGVYISGCDSFESAETMVRNAIVARVAQ